jgi:hypothetical protein
MRSSHLGRWRGSTSLRWIITPGLPFVLFLFLLFFCALAAYLFFALPKFVLLNLLLVV